MTLTIKLIRENESDNTVFFDFTESGVTFKFHADVPKDINTEAEARAYLIAHQDEILLLLMQEAYPGADISEFEGDGVSTLDAIKAWVAAGHKNPDVLDDEGSVIERQEVNTHPASIALNDEIDAMLTIADAKLILKKLVAML